MSAFTIKIDTIDDARRAIDIYSRTGADHRIPLIRATIEGRICHVEAQRSGSLLANSRNSSLKQAAARP